MGTYNYNINALTNAGICHFNGQPFVLIGSYSISDLIVSLSHSEGTDVMIVDF